MTLMRMFRILAIFCLSLVLYGCVGAAMLYKDTVPYNSDIILLSEKGYVKSIKPSGDPSIHKTKDVLERWGPPDKKEIDGTMEVWTYHHGITFSGVWLMVVIVPIPLVVPVGREDTFLYFTDNTLTKVEREYGRAPGVACGLMWDFADGGWLDPCIRW